MESGGDAEERRKSARHEAGHAVAALHHQCPFGRVTLDANWPAVGAIQLGVSKPSDAVVLFCGPLAERPWPDFRPGASIPCRLVGADLAALQYLELAPQETASLCNIALAFLSRPEVQQQVDRVASGLLERSTLSPEEVRAIAFESESVD